MKCFIHTLILKIKNFSLFLAAFLSTETLKGCNQYLCSECGAKNEAERKVEFLELPEILLIHLIRYETDPSNQSTRKFQRNFNVPEILNFSKFFDSSPKISFDLTGVITHNGTTPCTGHYYGKNGFRKNKTLLKEST